MKMMNDMMNMDGSMNDMGMDMSLQQMDMNTVMYPEITGESKNSKVEDTKAMKMDEKMDHSQHNMKAMSADIVTLNYGMLKSPTITTLPKDAPIKELEI